MVSDYKLLFDSTWHSLILLVSGYFIGVLIALVTGVTIGWFPHARYWGMPILKIVGPIPATAWIPLAMVVAPSAMFSAVGLVALATPGCAVVSVAGTAVNVAGAAAGAAVSVVGSTVKVAGKVVEKTIDVATPGGSTK